MDDRMLLEQLAAAVRNYDVSTFEAIFSKSPKKWSEMRIHSGRTLIQEAIIRKRKAIFKYILSFHKVINLETVGIYGSTPLTLAIDNNDKYYATELIRKGALPREEYETTRILKQSISKSVHLVKLLLDEGINPNVESDWPFSTALNYVLEGYSSCDVPEIVAMLLYYGADPLIEYKGFNSLELAIKNNHPIPVQEILCFYTFDECGGCKMHLNLLLQLLEQNSPLFHDILQFDVDCVTHNFTDADYMFVIKYLLSMDVHELTILLKKCNPAICEVVSWMYRDEILTTKVNAFLSCEQLLTKLNIFIESSPQMRGHVINLILTLKSCKLFKVVVSRSTKSTLTEILIFMFSYGLNCERRLLDIVFEKYGNCELFRFLSCLDVADSDAVYCKNIVVAMICDVHLELGSIFKNGRNYSRSSLFEVLHFSVNPQLLNFLLKNKGNVTDATVERIQCFPRLSSLIELARNALRGHIIERFKIRNAGHFGWVVNSLPVSNTHKRIILFQAELY
ncbi:hypothetical protein Zmor_027910 [Zophobas morio]|uniref:Ankyrin repeat protein n=1 Tax=Zophobas morio TaxID=2755281 RepID=A0AA38HNY4_9CUCU|nr:hypothetical protein Zmor_027910 [Zophobas morio]